ncbi:MAG: mechanosensitive ion channel family protein [Elusimicrobiota bacterium]|nr:mechanosensitive ion channel family protein [Elusimicrobiota bacterium]
MPDLEFLQRVYFGNSVAAYALAAATFVASVAVFLLARRLVLARLRALAESTATDLDDFAVELLGKIKAPECYLVGFYFATRPLSFDPKVDSFLRSAVILVLAYRALRMLQTSIDYGVRRAMTGPDADQARKDMAKTVALLLRFVLWVLALIFVLDNLGINVTSMVAGLGIGGVAVALAAQAVLGDLFSALAIHLDKPFVVGDFITVDDFKGTVERIGIKTTHLRSLSGELLVMGNSKLTSSPIRNYKKMRERRVVLNFGLLYSTPEKALAEMPGAVRGLIEKDKSLRFDRAHFSGLGESSLDFEVVYYILDADYNKHMDSQQRLLLELVADVRKRGLDFAYPTRTLFIDGGKAPAKA